MPNSIALVTKYLPMLDEVYKLESRSAVLDTPDSFVRETADAKTVQIAKISMSPLADYDRSTGFAEGDATLTWESHTFSYDRGRSFSIDAMDDAETLGLAFSGVAGQFVRTQVTPEVDAIRFATYATKSANHATEASLDAETIDAAIVNGEATLQNGEVALSGAYLFVNPNIYAAIKLSPSFMRTLEPSANPNRNFGSYDEMEVIVVPQSRFYTKVTVVAAGGYTKATDGYNINYMIINPNAVIQIIKHGRIRVFEPDVNQKADAYKIDYRIYHDAWVRDNGASGIYCSAVNWATTSGDDDDSH